MKYKVWSPQLHTKPTCSKEGDAETLVKEYVDMFGFRSANKLIDHDGDLNVYVESEDSGELLYFTFKQKHSWVLTWREQL